MALHCGEWISKVFRDSALLVVSSVHGFLPETEQWRSVIFKASLKAAALTHTLVKQKYCQYPWRLFRLLQDRSLATATDLLSDPPCTHDSLADQILTTYIAQALQLSTFTTERLHSKNAQHSRRRSTHLVEVGDLAHRACQEQLRKIVKTRWVVGDRPDPTTTTTGEHSFSK